MRSQKSKIERLTGDNPFQEIYDWVHIDELRDVIKNGGDIEDFIARKDAKKREEYITKVNEKYKNNIDSYKKNAQEYKEKLLALEEEKKLCNGSEYEVEKLNEKIEDTRQTLSAYESKLLKIQGSFQSDLNAYDSEDRQKSRDIENNNIRQFVAQKEQYIKNAPSISKEEIKTAGLSEDFIEGQIIQSKYAANVRSSVRRFYEGLDQPAAPMVAFAYGANCDPRAQTEVIEKLQAMGFNAVADTDEKAKDPTCFVVTKTSIQAPFMAPDEALKANVKMIEAICQAEHTEHPFLSNPLTREALAYATGAAEKNDNAELNIEYIAKNNGCNYQEITKGNIEGYLSSSLQEAFNKGISPNDLDKENAEAFNKGEAFKSIFHGGKCSSPYALLSNEDCMNFVYGAAGACGDAYASSNQYDGWNPDGALGYSFGKSTHNNRHLRAGELSYGFLFEYESRKDKQEFIGIDRAGGEYFDGGKFNRNFLLGASSRDETTVLPHQNKLKKMYITIRDNKGNVKILPLGLDEKGQVIDKKWRDFVDLHKPVDDNLKGFMVERRNNMIADFDAKGKEFFMDRTLDEVNSKSLEYVKSERKEVRVADREKIEKSQTMPPPIPTQTLGGQTMPPPIPAQTLGGQTMPPPIPAQTLGGQTMPPPIPTQTLGGQTMPPPIPTQTLGEQTMPPPIPTSVQDMSKAQAREFIGSLRLGVNPLLQPTTQSTENTQEIANTRSNIQINRAFLSQGHSM